jgi:uncharacterized protein (DUF1778 family)
MAGPYDTECGKKSIQVNVKMSEQEHDLIQRAAARLWPDAILSRASIVLGLAKIVAKQTVTRGR